MKDNGYAILIKIY